MLFNSYQFLLLFLPVTLAGYFLLARIQSTFAATGLALASPERWRWWLR
jgi:alginate O-acetyltransferase complex protein AlgI